MCIDTDDTEHFQTGKTKWHQQTRHASWQMTPKSNETTDKRKNGKFSSFVVVDDFVVADTDRFIYCRALLLHFQFNRIINFLVCDLLNRYRLITFMSRRKCWENEKRMEKRGFFFIVVVCLFGLRSSGIVHRFVWIIHRMRLSTVRTTVTTKTATMTTAAKVERKQTANCDW